MSDGTGIFSAELGSPFRCSLKRDFYAALCQQIFYMTQAQRKAEIEPHRMRYDLGGKTMTLMSRRRDIVDGFGLMPVSTAANV